MSTAEELVVELVAIADAMSEVLDVPSTTDQLSALVHTARVAFGAAACSVSVVDNDGLRYVASDGIGSDEIVGVRVELTASLAGYVASTGQLLAIDDVRSDRRFAREIAESTGYLPTAMLLAPITSGDGGEVVGVLSVLDRSGPEAASAMALATALAAQAGVALRRADSVSSIGAVLFAALAAAGPSDDLAEVLGLVDGDTRNDPDGAAALASVVAGLRRASPQLRAAAIRILDELVAVGRPARPRR